MDKPHKKTAIGIQGSVMGWNDPWHTESCDRLLRTGEGQWFPSQDPAPSREAFLALINSFGADYYMHSVMPVDEEIDAFIEDISSTEMKFMLNNEFGDINGPFAEGTNRYDVPDDLAKKAAATGKFLGLIYDETEHLQLHPHQYRQNLPEFNVDEPRHQWADTDGKTLQQAEDAVSQAVRNRLNQYGSNIPCYSEQVFPVMYHTLARAGMNLCPKLLKEEFQSLQLATALGAAKQYDRSLGICVDLWGQDVGAWFTRMWGFPAHSPTEYKSALELGYLMAPDFLFTENVDGLAVHRPNGFQKTEFGDVFEAFIKEFIPRQRRPYSHLEAQADIVLIRSDDTDWREGGTLFGSRSLASSKETQSAFHAFHLLSRGALPKNGITFFLPQYPSGAGRYPRTKEALRSLPLAHGVPEAEADDVHKLFYPLNNTLVLDERADSRAIGNPKLIVLAGSRMTEACLKAVSEKVRAGAVCIAAEWLLPMNRRHSMKDGEGQWIVVSDLLSEESKSAAEPFLGRKDCWTQRFGDHQVRIYNPSGDGISLEFEVASS